MERSLDEGPDRAPHAMVIGPSGAGKTTFTAAMLGKRAGSTLVLSPKVNAGNWRGAEVITLDDEGQYTPIAAALDALEAEKRRRIKALRQGQGSTLRPLTVVLDETPELLRFVPDTGPFMVSMSSIGRELGVRLVVISTRAEALNVKGWKASQGNFVRVDLDRDRNATLDDGMQARPLDLGQIQKGAELARLHPWRATEAPQVEPAEGETTRLAPAPVDLSYLLDQLLAESVTSASQSPSNTQGVTVTVTDTTGNGNGNAPVTAQVTGPGNGPAVTIYAQALATGAPSAPPPGRARPRRGRGLDVRRRRQLATVERNRGELAAAYTAARRRGVKSFRAAYAELGGNRKEALAAWQAAEGR